MEGKTYTTTEISEICDVYPATVINWIGAGKLKAYVTPGGHRRVIREDLIEFLKKCEIPIPEELYSDKRRVLIVEDEPEMVRLVERAFAKHSGLFSTQSASSGIEALVQIGQKAPHLMVLDIVMPGMDGLELCAKLRSMPETSSVKIIAITGKKMISEKNISSHGIHVLLRKPFSLDQLVQTAAKLLRVRLPVDAKSTLSR